MIVRWGSRKIKVFFNERKVEKQQEKEGGFIHGFVDKSTDEIYIRSKTALANQRMTLWHELSHLIYDTLSSLSDESLSEINARFIDEIMSRNKWIRELYK